MYELVTRNKRVEKKIKEYIKLRPGIKNKLDMIRLSPRKSCKAHPYMGV